MPERVVLPAPGQRPLLTKADFEARAGRVWSIALKKAAPFYAAAGVLFIAVGITDSATLPDWIERGIVLTFIGSLLGALWAMARSEDPALRELGLLCPRCHRPLPGGQHGEATRHVATTGRCTSCGAQVLEDVVTAPSCRGSAREGGASSWEPRS